MALGIIAEWLARIEHKLDLLLNTIGGTHLPMHFVGHSCPVCKKNVDYQIDIGKNVVTRRCGCSTGKLPMTVPLTPVDINGELNGNTSSNRSDANGGTESGSEYRKRR